MQAWVSALSSYLWGVGRSLNQASWQTTQNEVGDMCLSLSHTHQSLAGLTVCLLAVWEEPQLVHLITLERCSHEGLLKPQLPWEKCLGVQPQQRLNFIPRSNNWQLFNVTWRLSLKPQAKSQRAQSESSRVLAGDKATQAWPVRCCALPGGAREVALAAGQRWKLSSPRWATQSHSGSDFPGPAPGDKW